MHASFIHSDREIFRFSHDLSMVAVRSSSIVTEYRTILDLFAGAPDRFFDYYESTTQKFIARYYRPHEGFTIFSVEGDDGGEVGAVGSGFGVLCSASYSSHGDFRRDFQKNMKRSHPCVLTCMV